jgi:outer membrane protein assembly factor BamE
MRFTPRQFAAPVLLASLALGLSGCSHLKFPGVYRINVQQGNIIDQKKLDQIKPGMTKRQVQFLLGSPLLIDTFNPDRWDYLYSVKRGEKILGEKRFSVIFEGDKLARYEGDVRPGGPSIADPKLDERMPTPQEQAEINANSDKKGRKKKK